MTFKCETCNNWNDGKGNDCCLNCTKYRHVGRENFKLEIDYYASYEDFPDVGIWESLYPVGRKHDIWSFINQLEKREATMLVQYYFLDMTQEEIGKLSGTPRRTVGLIISRAIEQLRDM